MSATITKPNAPEQKEEFLAAKRQIGLLAGAGSIAASWIWAPALFTSAEMGFRYGWEGVAWFLVPNVLVLVLFGVFATRMRNRLPYGYTLSGFMHKVYGKRVKRAYMFQLSALATCSFAVQLIGGGAIIAKLLGIPFWTVSLALGLIAFSYSVAGGIRASIFTDYLHMATTLFVVAILIPLTVATVSWDTIVTGMSSANVDHVALALSFGIPTTIGLLSGPFGDQSFWQRSFSLQKKAVKPAFNLAAAVFAIVPICMSFLGFAAVGTGLEVDNPQFVNFAVVENILPGWAIIPFVIMVVGCLLATIDSQLNSIASIAGNDIKHQDTDGSVKRARWAMVVILVLATLIANIPGVGIVHLFLIYGTLRAATLAPTIITLLRRDTMPAERGVFWGIVLALSVGLPVFIYGSFFTDNPLVKPLGSLLTIGIAATLTLALSGRRGTPVNEGSHEAQA